MKRIIEKKQSICLVLPELFPLYRSYGGHIASEQHVVKSRKQGNKNYYAQMLKLFCLRGRLHLFLKNRFRKQENNSDSAEIIHNPDSNLRGLQKTNSTFNGDLLNHQLSQSFSCNHVNFSSPPCQDTKATLVKSGSSMLQNICLTSELNKEEFLAESDILPQPESFVFMELLDKVDQNNPTINHLLSDNPTQNSLYNLSYEVTKSTEKYESFESLLPLETSFSFDYCPNISDFQRYDEFPAIQLNFSECLSFYHKDKSALCSIRGD